MSDEAMQGPSRTYRTPSSSWLTSRSDSSASALDEITDKLDHLMRGNQDMSDDKGKIQS
jgi:hypothetical protein